MAARNRGAAVLLVSEDLDELLELADRVVVMFNGQLVYETRASAADLTESVATWRATKARPEYGTRFLHRMDYSEKSDLLKRAIGDNCASWE